MSEIENFPSQLAWTVEDWKLVFTSTISFSIYMIYKINSTACDCPDLMRLRRSRDLISKIYAYCISGMRPMKKDLISQPALVWAMLESGLRIVYAFEITVVPKLLQEK